MRFSASLLIIAGASSLLAQPPIGPSFLPNRKIHSNDLLSVTVLGQPDLTRNVRADADGLIRLPMLKDKLQAAGLLPAQLENSIAAALIDQQILVDPDVTVTVAEYYRPLGAPISVVGAVRNPITFQPAGKTTLLEAITRAGGLTAEAGSEILIGRGADNDGDSDEPSTRQPKTGLTTRVRVRALFDSTEAGANMPLTGGEEIRVPEAGRIYVFGNVKKPGMFPVEDGAGTTAFRAIALSEGLAPYASNQAFIYRQEPGNNTRSEIAVELKRIIDRSSPDVPLQANDILYVPDATARRNTMTSLKIIGGLGTVVLSALIYLVLR